MKVNNNGWSLNTMIVLTVVLFLAVILVCILFYNFDKDEEYVSISNEYITIEVE